MSVEANKDLERRFVAEVFNQGNLALIDEICARDWKYNGTDGEVFDQAKLKQVLTMWRRGMPDLHATIELMVAEREDVALRTTFVGTHTGQYFDLEPTGKRVSGVFHDFDRIVNGRIAESWELASPKGFYEQITGAPPPGGVGGNCLSPSTGCSFAYPLRCFRPVAPAKD